MRVATYVDWLLLVKLVMTCGRSVSEVWAALSGAVPFAVTSVNFG